MNIISRNKYATFAWIDYTLTTVLPGIHNSDKKFMKLFLIRRISKIYINARLLGFQETKTPACRQSLHYVPRDSFINRKPLNGLPPRE